MNFYRIIFVLLVLTVSAHGQADSIEQYYSDQATHIYSAAATTNYGSLTTIATLRRPSPARSRWILIRPDSTGMGIPTGGYELKTCSLFLWNTHALNSRTLTVYRVLKDWVESEATWNIWSTGNDWGTAGASSTGNDNQDNTGDGTGNDRWTTAMTSRVTELAWEGTWVGFEIDTGVASGWVNMSDTIDAGLIITQDVGAIQTTTDFHSDDNDSVPYFQYTWTIPLVAGNLAYRHRADSTYYRHADAGHFKHEPE